MYGGLQSYFIDPNKLMIFFPSGIAPSKQAKHNKSFRKMKREQKNWFVLSFFKVIIKKQVI